MEETLGTLQAIQAAITEAFRTPEIVRLFARKEPAQLRLKLAEVPFPLYRIAPTYHASLSWSGTRK